LLANVRFLMVDGALQLCVALLFAALLGAMVVLVAGAARVLQRAWSHDAIAATTRGRTSQVIDTPLGRLLVGEHHT
jgi:hypothetical protein